MDVQFLIDKAGSVSKLAGVSGVSHSTVCDWKRLGFIPGNRVAQISDKLDLPVELVITLVKQPREQKRPAKLKQSLHRDACAIQIEAR